MWKPSKLTLFIIFITMTVCAGISVAYIDWDVIASGKGVFKELQQPVLFILLSLYFMFPYVKKLKEESASKDSE
jgi:hypothetical protein